jgi:hypothetical protein
LCRHEVLRARDLGGLPMTLADCPEEGNREALEARKTPKIMTPFAESSIPVPH